jgi:hypothetical protein
MKKSFNFFPCNQNITTKKKQNKKKIKKEYRKSKLE